jgi:hypothetical protein
LVIPSFYPPFFSCLFSSVWEYRGGFRSAEVLAAT